MNQSGPMAVALSRCKNKNGCKLLTFLRNDFENQKMS